MFKGWFLINDCIKVSYKGVPTNGQSCKQAYKLPANQMKCTKSDGHH